ncbi:hypothetical protein JKY79_02310 [Candidatus Babeliales bacterium]|nr:hypothetical protein [Candidatus Babeliales bacterium]
MQRGALPVSGFGSGGGGRKQDAVVSDAHAQTGAAGTPRRNLGRVGAGGHNARFVLRTAGL